MPFECGSARRRCLRTTTTRDGVIRVELSDDDGPDERLTDVIAQGEQGAVRAATAPDGRRRELVVDFSVAARNLVADVAPNSLPMLQAREPFEGRRSGGEYLAAVVDTDLVALYGIRRRAGRRESGEPQ